VVTAVADIPARVDAELREVGEPALVPSPHPAQLAHRALNGRPARGKCVRASGLIYRSQSVRTEKRHKVTTFVFQEKDRSCAHSFRAGYRRGERRRGST
jgi:hypothetical protein